MSYFDRRRDPQANDEMAQVTVRLPGEPNAPQSAGHKVPPPRVQAARRIQTMVNAQNGAALDKDMDDRLRHMAARERAHGIAVGSHCRSADPFAGYLADGPHYVRFRGAADTLRWIFGVSG